MVFYARVSEENCLTKMGIFFLVASVRSKGALRQPSYTLVPADSIMYLPSNSTFAFSIA